MRFTAGTWSFATSARAGAHRGTERRHEVVTSDSSASLMLRLTGTGHQLQSAATQSGRRELDNASLRLMPLIVRKADQNESYVAEMFLGSRPQSLADFCIRSVLRSHAEFGGV